MGESVRIRGGISGGGRRGGGIIMALPFGAKATI
jgi:hypothetical protein